MSKEVDDLVRRLFAGEMRHMIHTLEQIRVLVDPPERCTARDCKAVYLVCTSIIETCKRHLEGGSNEKR